MKQNRTEQHETNRKQNEQKYTFLRKDQCDSIIQEAIGNQNRRL